MAAEGKTATTHLLTGNKTKAINEFPHVFISEKETNHLPCLRQRRWEFESCVFLQMLLLTCTGTCLRLGTFSFVVQEASWGVFALMVSVGHDSMSGHARFPRSIPTTGVAP